MIGVRDYSLLRFIINRWVCFCSSNWATSPSCRRYWPRSSRPILERGSAAQGETVGWRHPSPPDSDPHAARSVNASRVHFLPICQWGLAPPSTHRGHTVILNGADFTRGVTLVTFGIKLHTRFVILAYASSQPSEDVHWQ